MAPNTTTPSNNSQSIRHPIDLLDVLLRIQSIYSTPELDAAIFRLKGNEPGAEITARRVVFELTKSFFHDAASGASEQLMNEFTKLTTTVADLEAKVALFLTRVSAEDVSHFLVPGSLKARYFNEHAEEKKALAKYIANNQLFFPDNERIFAFIQASVTSIHLCRELSQKTLRAGCLFATNSVVIPMIMLQDNSQISVYTLCGAEYDNLCGGWLPRNDDEGALNYVRDLFSRSKDPLKDAYITPMAVACDKGDLYFTRSELLSVVKVLIQRASRLVVMTVSSRLLSSKAETTSHPALINTALYPINPMSGPIPNGSRPHMIVARDPTDRRSETELKNLIGELNAKGFCVHWQDDKLAWHAPVEITTSK